ncbi:MULTISPECIES: hypothetical protein [unclassified Chryseobacterium]|uniref:hypothetical protein n=1 Tax=unclassified Chryseobacterium TaxID=2593645 RepID=UPI00301644F9
MKEIIKLKRGSKKVITAFLLLGIGSAIYSQVGVTLVEDINNDMANQERQVAMMKQLQEAQTQSSKLQGMKETIKKNLNYLEKVNSQVQNVQAIKDLAKRQAQVFNNCVRLKNKYSNNPNIEVVLYTTRATNQILQDTQNNINEISKILSSGVFNMGDADRLDFIRQYKEDTEEKMAQYDMAKAKAEKFDWAMKIYNMKNPKR